MYRANNNIKISIYFRMACMVAGLSLAFSANASKTYFVHNDHLGTPQVITDENKNVRWEADKDPWGNATHVISSLLPNNISLPGQYNDIETGYADNWWRSYDSKTGQYLQSDPIGLVGGLNSYVYVGDPLTETDPKGLSGSRGAPVLPDKSACAYYQKICKQTGCRYYCFTAPFMCQNAAYVPPFWGTTNVQLNCVRKCLVREDAKRRSQRTEYQCPAGNCLSDDDVNAYHQTCYIECNVGTWRYPGVNPSWLPYNPNKK